MGAKDQTSIDLAYTIRAIYKTVLHIGARILRFLRDIHSLDSQEI